MTDYKRGDVALVGFFFADGSGRKFRPAVVISSPGYLRGRQEVVVAAITSNVRRRLFGDYRVADWEAAGLLFPSVVTGTIRSIKRAMLVRRLGALSKRDLDAVGRELRRSLGL